MHVNYTPAFGNREFEAEWAAAQGDSHTRQGIKVWDLGASAQDPRPIVLVWGGAPEVGCQTTYVQHM